MRLLDSSQELSKYVPTSYFCKEKLKFFKSLFEKGIENLKILYMQTLDLSTLINSNA